MKQGINRKCWSFSFFWLFHALKRDSHLGDQISPLEGAWGMDFLGVFFVVVDQLIYESFVCVFVRWLQRVSKPIPRSETGFTCASGTWVAHAFVGRLSQNLVGLIHDDSKSFHRKCLEITIYIHDKSHFPHQPSSTEPTWQLIAAGHGWDSSHEANEQKGDGLQKPGSKKFPGENEGLDVPEKMTPIFEAGDRI